MKLVQLYKESWDNLCNMFSKIYATSVKVSLSLSLWKMRNNNVTDPWNLYLVFGLMAITNEASHVKFGILLDHKQAYKLCIKYCLRENNYKYEDGANFEVMSDKICRSE